MSNTNFYADLKDAKEHLHEMADAISSIKVSDENSLLLRDLAEERVSLAHCILENVLDANNSYSNELIINGISITRYEDSLFCANDIHRASGGERRHDPYDFMRQKKTKKLIDSIPGMMFEKKYVVKGGSLQGTYVCREILYAYAIWIDPVFYVKVLAALHALKPIKWGCE